MIKLWIWKLWIWLLLFSSMPAAAGITLEQLMQSLATVSAVSAHFRETKQLAILQEPLYSTGILRYRAPDYVKKQTILPQRESFELKDDQLFIDHPEKGKHQLNLNDYPVVRAFVESFRATLAGDINTLKRYYRIQLQGQVEAWQLTLMPLESQMAEAIDTIVISGQDARILAIETLETNGDRSMMSISPTNE